MMRKIILYTLTTLLTISLYGNNRKDFDECWKFRLTDEADISSPSFDDSSWRNVNLPHDWSIEGNFDESSPTGTGGGALRGGIAWYRKHFNIKKYDDVKYYIDFDGVYMNSDVYLNGHLLGNRPYGYISFEYDMTKWLINGNNVIAVRVDNSLQPNSRWYSGSGIYRNVYLVTAGTTHIAHWGTYVTSQIEPDGKAVLNISVKIENNGNKPVKAIVTNKVINRSGNVVVSDNKEIGITSSSSNNVNQKVIVSKPILWSLDNPYLYTVLTTIKVGNKIVDTSNTPIGIRSIEFDAGKGFFLNGKNVRINGVCNHHDLGCLGSAFNSDALHRQLVILKNMGCNAIRCSHNPPAPELLAMCDSMGFLVMDEAFDMWHKRKTMYDYARFFDKWYERDLSDMIIRDGNHPSISLWSIGSEVMEQWRNADADTMSIEQANLILNLGHDSTSLARKGEVSASALIARKLAAIVKSLDITRPIIAGCNEPSPQNHIFSSGALDVIGYNYHIEKIPDVPKNFPNMPFLISESVSSLHTRGYYKMPSDSIYFCPPRRNMQYADPSFSCSSYDNSHAIWSSTHEQTWDVVKHTPYVCGQFIWTGFDYIGEPTPYGWPARSSYFGIIDLAGFPKDIYYMYQSEWTDKTVLHLFPHWNWTPGQDIDLWAYYNNADEVELFVNGKSQGIKRKDEHTYHVWWRVKYEPGEIKAVSRKNGKIVAEQTIHTAGEPAQIRLTTDRTMIKADGKSLSFITVDILDKDGNLCPEADNDITFNVSGEAVIAGVDNGSQFSLESFKANHRKAFHGKCLVVIQSTKKNGVMNIAASSNGLKTAKKTLSSYAKI